MQTWFEYMRTMPPSKLARFLRQKLAYNQGCPPASLMQVFTMCQDYSSCDECWWAWLDSERDEAKDDSARQVEAYRCWDCRWGANGEHGGHNFVGCMHPRFYGAIMEPDDFCSEGVPKYQMGKALDKTKQATEVALEHDFLTEENAEAIGRELKRRYEVKQLKRELKRREREGGNNETSGKREEDHEPEK